MPFQMGHFSTIYEFIKVNELAADEGAFMRRADLRGLKRVVVLCCIAWISACGYHFAPDMQAIDKQVHKIFVDVFDNKTSEANIENIVRSAFADQIIKGRRFKLAVSRDEADAILSGSIDSLSASALSYQVTNIAAEDRMTIVLSLVLEARDPRKILWTNSSLTGVQDYNLGTNPTVAQANKKDALIKLANDTAERAYRFMMSGF